MSHVSPVERQEIARQECVDEDEHAEGERVPGHLEHAHELRLVGGRAHVTEGLEDGEEGRAEEVGEELLDDQDGVLGEGVLGGTLGFIAN